MTHLALFIGLVSYGMVKTFLVLSVFDMYYNEIEQYL